MESTHLWNVAIRNYGLEGTPDGIIAWVTAVSSCNREATKVVIVEYCGTAQAIVNGYKQQNSMKAQLQASTHYQVSEVFLKTTRGVTQT